MVFQTLRTAKDAMRLPASRQRLTVRAAGTAKGERLYWWIFPNQH
jgi:hypothetical protein